MWLNVIKAKLNAKQCWPVVAPRTLVRGGLGLYAGVLVWFTARPRMSSHSAFAFAIG